TSLSPSEVSFTSRTASSGRAPSGSIRPIQSWFRVIRQTSSSSERRLVSARQRSVTHCGSLLVACQERGSLDTGPERLTLRRQSFDGVEIGLELERSGSPGRPQPSRKRLGGTIDERQHRLPPEAPVRLLIIGISIVARNAEQHGRHAQR